jgi:diaminopimelate decarboxylase
MTEKKIPFSRELIERIASAHPTPFHLYDEAGIRATVRRLKAAFSWAPEFNNFFAIKATPNPHIVRILQSEGFGADCSSLAELILAERIGITGENIMFSSNDTPADEYQKARELGGILNLDDVSHIPFVEKCCGLPDLLSFRYNPGSTRTGNFIIGKPEEAKFGCTREQLLEAYKTIKKKGVRRFGLHSNVASNERDPNFFIETGKMLFEMAVLLQKEAGVRLEFVNLGGGIGIPYRLEDEAVDLEYVGQGIRDAYESIIRPAGLHPLKIFMENGRVVTGPHGYLVSRVLHHKDIYKHYVGLDACMANLMRPALYGAYHHITVLGKENEPLDHVYDVTGSLCENNDKFAVDRPLPKMDVGDLVVIHDAGAHGHAMGFNYNGKLRSAEMLVGTDGKVRLIRRAETIEDYFATVDFAADSPRVI